MNWAARGLSRPNDSFAFCARAGFNSGDTNLSTGSPGEILSSIKMKQTIKNSTIREEINLLTTSEKSLFECIIY